ncbi:hypothetical protein SAMN02745945_02738 [Peptoclostridium litorale DSM 5388]|uniref:Uncharacterized protein n=1 Tax=Peptoclostridium litorale DSM 5388 TaxID=1121324 RepID=A0A069RES4_PEPLI|nr:hypothetical protein [Peptoclostridium litorale]KDR94690.1 hypothetical protein CLIT_13c00120 [Peptoclostridium litorale DSM 5388]SIO32666.1 hypothetical protein SAMN02745945_02738 [Peptoclostridium litorale DSM 5388]
MFCRVKQLFKLYYEEQSHFTDKKRNSSSSCSAAASKRGKDTLSFHTESTVFQT